MSTSSVSSTSTSTATSANQFSTGSSLQSLGSGSPLQVTGLASGLDTNAIVTALMQANTQRVTNLTNQQNALAAKNTQLGNIQTSLQSVASDAMAMFDPSLYAKTQTVSSTNSALIGATAINKNGAVQGGYQVAVTQLATSAQRTFTYTPPSQADTVTIDGKDVPVAAGASIQTFVSSINNNNNLDVWATATDSGTVVLSNRATGQQTSSYIQVSESNATKSLTEQTGLAQAGQDAIFTVNNSNPPLTSPSNTVTTAIPGVSLSLNGLTTGGASVTVDVGSPAANTENIQSAVSQFVKDYNSALTQIQTQLSQKPTSSDPTQGTLYGDSELKDLLSRMRTAMYTNGSGLPHGMASMLDIGVSTGASTGSGPSQGTLSGQLSLDATALTSAITSNPTGVEAIMGSWANSFSTIVNSAAGGGGTISIRIQDDTHQSSNLASQISNLQAANALKQSALVQQFSKMEAALSDSQSTSTWLNSQINALPTIR